MLPGGASQVTSYAYNAQGNVTQVTDPVGRVTKYNYYTGGIDLQSVQQKSGSGANDFTTLESFGTYSAAHRPASRTNMAGDTASFTWNSGGQLTQVTDEGGRVTKFAYDSLGRPTTVQRTVGGTDQTLETKGYTANCGLPTYTTHPNCNLPATITDSEGRALSYQYDALDRVTKVTYPDATYEQFTYTRLDLTGYRDRLARNTSYGYNANRWLSSVTEPVASGGTRTTYYNYYRNGVLNWIEDAKTPTAITSWDVDLNGRITGKSYPGGTGGFSQTYDSAGRPDTRTDGYFQSKHLHYNADDTISSITYGNPYYTVSTPTVTFEYDEYYPRRTAMYDATGATYYGYVDPGQDGAGKLLWEDGPENGDVLVYGYDALGRMTGRTVEEVGGNVTESWAYDAYDRVTTHGTGLGSFTYTYLGKTAQPASRSLGGTSITTSWSYNTNANDRRLTGITHSSGARSYTITANQVRISAIAETASTAASWAARSWSYGYDDADRLTSAVSNTPSLNYTYAYDKLDNFTSFTNTAASSTLSPTINAANQQSGFGGTFTFDGNGNLSSEPSRTYKWDIEHRLGEITQGSTTVRFEYDGLGRRARMFTTTGGSTVETRWLWSGDQLIHARTSSDAITRRYYPEGEQRPGASPEKLVYMTDHLGSVRDVVNGATGAMVAAFDYSPYGGTQRSWGSVTPDFTYAGLRREPTSGLLLSQTRAYNHHTGKWLNRDPIAEKGGLNLYAYTGGNPLNNIDPRGELGIGAVLGAGFGAFSGGVGAWQAGGSPLEVAGAAFFGAATGLLVGLVDPSEGALTIAILSSGAALTADVAAQLLVSRGRRLDYAQSLGAAVGGFVGGGLGSAVGRHAATSWPCGDLAENVLAGMVGFLPSTFGPEAGKEVSPIPQEPDRSWDWSSYPLPRQ